MERQKASSNIEVKRNNRNRVFRYIAGRKRTSRPEIAEALGMSVPTVMQMVNELIGLGVVREAGELKSTGGRKAKAVSAVWDARYSVGIDITANHLGLLLTDLSERVLFHRRIDKPFLSNEDYFRELGEICESVLEENGIPRERVLGAGIAIPGVVDSLSGQIHYSHALKVSGLEGRAIQKYLPYPCALLNDANAAGRTEGRGQEAPENLVYLSLSNTVGGAVVLKGGGDAAGAESLFGGVYVGGHWRSGEFGHMVIHPGGEGCYCGKRGCLDAYCSALRLAKWGGGRLEDFFRRLEEGDEDCIRAFETYQEHLAIAVENLHVAFDCDVVLGGYVGSFFEPYLEEFRRRIAAGNIFEDQGEYVKVCRYRVEASAFGAALYHIDQYVRQL